MKRRTTKSKQNNNKQGNFLSKYEKQAVSRLRTNTMEFASVVRGAVTDSNTGGVTAQSYAFLLNNPGWYRTPAGGFAQCPTLTPLLADEVKVFDEYRVIKLTLKYMPWVTGQVRVNTAVAFTAPSDPTLVMSIDYDDPANWVSNAQCLASQNPGVYHAYEPRMQVLSMVQKDSVDGRKWLNFQAITPSGTTPADPNNPAKLASIKVRKFGYQLASTTEATFYPEWTILLKAAYTLA